MKPTLLIILGQTSTGKSDFAVSLAKYLYKTEKIHCEIVSADSRQVYKELNLLSGKIREKEMRGIPHHLLSLYSAQRNFSVAMFQKKAHRTIGEIIARGNLPILVGGTGFYIQSIVDGIVFPEVKKNKTLRKELEQKTTDELILLLKKKDPNRLKEIDISNRIRLIRALEIAICLGKIPIIKKNPKYTTAQIGLTMSDEVLRTRIQKRLLKRIKQGMLEEAQSIHENAHISYRRMAELGLESKYSALYLQKKITKENLIAELETKIWQYARRQRTWFRKDSRIHWIHLEN